MSSSIRPVRRTRRPHWSHPDVHLFLPEELLRECDHPEDRLGSERNSASPTRRGRQAHPKPPPNFEDRTARWDSDIPSCLAPRQVASFPGGVYPLLV